MPELEISVGGKTFAVACQAGEEDFLRAAAALLDAEARPLVAQTQSGRLPEARMLLMAGLMLADRLAGVEDQLRVTQARLARLEAQPAPEPMRIEVPVIPAAVTESLAEIAARLEALAATAEERAGEGAGERAG
jgi:cell division protein ZapA